MNNNFNPNNDYNDGYNNNANQNYNPNMNMNNQGNNNQNYNPNMNMNNQGYNQPVGYGGNNFAPQSMNNGNPNMNDNYNSGLNDNNQGYNNNANQNYNNNQGYDNQGMNQGYDDGYNMNNNQNMGYDDGYNNNYNNDYNNLDGYAYENNYDYEEEEEESSKGGGIVYYITELKERGYLWWVIAALIIIIIIIILLLTGCGNRKGNLNSIDVQAPQIVYVGEDDYINVSAVGTGNLKATKYHFTNSDNDLLKVADETLSGASARNTLSPVAPGKVYVDVVGEFGSFRTSKVENPIVICNVLDKNAFQDGEYKFVKNVPTKLEINLGDQEECYKALKFKSQDEKILTVDEDGNVLGLEEGETIIEISDGKHDYELPVEVIGEAIKVTGIKATSGTMNITVGQKKLAEYTITPADATNKKYTCVSSNEGIAIVDANCYVTGVAVGTTTVTATTEDGGHKATITVNVKAKSTGGGGGSTDKTAPTLTVVRMTSTNLTTSYYAKVGDTITVSITASEELGTAPKVTIAGQSASVSGSGTRWTATTKVTSSTKEGEASLSISGYKDKAGNSGSTVTRVTTGQLTVIDRTPPTITNATMISNKSGDPYNAVVGSSITVSITFNEKWKIKPTVTVGGQKATVTCYTATTCEGKITVTSAFPTGSLALNISGYGDYAGNIGATRTSTTDGKTINNGGGGSSSGTVDFFNNGKFSNGISSFSKNSDCGTRTAEGDYLSISGGYAVVFSNQGTCFSSNTINFNGVKSYTIVYSCTEKYPGYPHWGLNIGFHKDTSYGTLGHSGTKTKSVSGSGKIEFTIINATCNISRIYGTK